MIVLLPESSWGKGGTERGRELVTQPGIRHLLRGPPLLVPRIPGLEETPLTFQSLSFIRETEPRDFSVNDSSAPDFWI